MATLELLTVSAIKEKMELLHPHWVLKEKELHLAIQFSDFETAITFINKVAKLAIKQNHHPKIINEYNRVLLELITHDADGLTAKDFELAQAIDSL